MQALFTKAALLLLLLAVASALQGEIISCSSWKLNRLPEVRRFLKEPGHADAYDNLKVKFVHGKPPMLHIKGDDGVITESIDLSPVSDFWWNVSLQCAWLPACQ
jgi:hypothetical protein